MEKSRILLGITSPYILHLEQMGKHLVKQNPNHIAAVGMYYVRQVLKHLEHAGPAELAN